jgi:hypothetical protein
MAILPEELPMTTFRFIAVSVAVIFASQVSAAPSEDNRKFIEQNICPDFPKEQQADVEAKMLNRLKDDAHAEVEKAMGALGKSEREALDALMKVEQDPGTSSLAQSIAKEKIKALIAKVRRPHWKRNENTYSVSINNRPYEIEIHYNGLQNAIQVWIGSNGSYFGRNYYAGYKFDALTKKVIESPGFGKPGLTIFGDMPSECKSLVAHSAKGTAVAPGSLSSR